MQAQPSRAMSASREWQVDRGSKRLSRQSCSLGSTSSATVAQYITSYTVAFLSPDPVTMYLSSEEMSQLRTEEDSFDWRRGESQKRREREGSVPGIWRLRTACATRSAGCPCQSRRTIYHSKRT